MGQLRAECHLTACRQGDASVLDYFTFFVWLESKFISTTKVVIPDDQPASLFDGEFPRLTIVADSLVDSSICTTADETNNFVPIKDSHFAGIPI